MAERVWLKSYSPGIPADIDVSQYESVLDFFDETIRKFADKPAFSNFGKNLSFAHLDELSGRFASFLQKLGGLNPDDCVAVMLPNLLQYPIVLFGILRAGMTVVNINPLYTARELEPQLKDSGAKAIIVLENFAATLQKVIAHTALEHVITSQLGDMMSAPRRWLMNFIVKRVKKIVPLWRIADAIPLRRALRHGARAPFTPIEVGHDDIAFLQYTGGTPGVAKGAMLSHYNMLANLEQTNLWISGSFKEGREITIAPLPMYHIFCLTSTLAFMESVVMMHPGVAECAVIGVADEHSGEAVKLFVVRRDAALTQEEIVSYCKSELTGYKRPHQIEFRASLPKTPIGKILRRELRDAEQNRTPGDRT